MPYVQQFHEYPDRKLWEDMGLGKNPFLVDLAEKINVELLSLPVVINFFRP